MISVTKADGIAQWELIKQLNARSGETDRRVTAAVSEILEDVRADGDRAVR